MIEEEKISAPYKKPEQMIKGDPQNTIPGDYYVFEYELFQIQGIIA
jgi:hypothetical protein